ncbi:MAG: cytochrome c biogenesis protein CcsA [Alistipes sp.]|nr:cytochrome c biogenesis protein CcsA [Alistipes sp.]
MMSLMREIYLMLTQWRATLLLLLLLSVALAGATWLESSMNSEAARAVVYNAWWFLLLLGLLILNFIGVSLRLGLWRRRRWGALLLHYGFAVILFGALTTHIWGFEGVMHIREGASSDRLMTSRHEARTLPFTVTLNRFALLRYPGSQTPSAYQSEVTIAYQGQRIDRLISMNQVAHVAGYRLYQSSYDPDERGTILSVNYDPVGTALSYGGYLMLCVGLIGAVGASGSRLRRLYARLPRQAMLVLWGCGIALGAEAYPVTTPDRAEAHRFGGVLVHSSEGRIEPVESYASEILRKLYHRDHYQGLTPNQVLLGLWTDPTAWRGEPLLYTGKQPLPAELGIQGAYVSLDGLFDAAHRYRLHDAVERIYAKPATARTKGEQAVLKLDERVNILYGLLRGALLPVLPDATGARWYSPSDTLPEAVQAAARLLEQYRQGIVTHTTSQATQALEQFKALQYAGLPQLRPGQIEAERLYNRADLFRWAFRGDLILGGVLLGLTLWGIFRGRSRRLQRVQRGVMVGIFVLFGLHTLGLALRGYISGHAPWTTAYESMVYVGWATVLSGIIFSRRSPLVLALATLLGGVVLFVSHLNWLDPQITPLVPVLKSYWLMIHVSVVTASYGFFGICAVCGITALLAAIARRPLPELRIVNEMAMIIGLVLLTIGIFFGAVWANESWGRYWGWDPKETWALITMLVYAAVVHLHFIPRLYNKPLFFDVLSVLSFSTVLMTFFGVNYLLSGLHSYGRSEGLSGWIVAGSAMGVGLLIGVARWRQAKEKPRL